MQETAAAQALLVIESIRRVTGKSIINRSLHCLTLAEGSIDMIEEKTKVTNDIRDFRNVFGLSDPEAGKRQVYFLYCAGFVKIGVARSILRRAAELQIGSPWKSQIVLLIPGGRLTEAFLHFAFQEHRVGGEWFRLTPPIREAIKEMAPAECIQWLAEEEEAYREWVRLEASHLGLITDEKANRRTSAAFGRLTVDAEEWGTP